MDNIIIVSVCAWTIAQLLKVIIFTVSRRQLDLRLLVTSGGVPSSHSAIVCALATAVGFVEGLDSVSFGISLILAFIVMYDAAGLRRSVGKQAVVLNRIVMELKERRPMVDFGHDLRELIGHTFPQVLAGALLGIATAAVWYTFLVV